jgi:hypothetical protein
MVVVCQGHIFSQVSNNHQPDDLFCIQQVQVGSDPTSEDNSERTCLDPDVEPLLRDDWELDALEDLISKTLIRVFLTNYYYDFWTKNFSYEKEYKYLK